MPTLQAEAMRLLKAACTPNTMEIPKVSQKVLEIAGDLDCHPDTVWRAWRKYKEKFEKIQEEYKILEETINTLEYLLKLLIEFAKTPRELTIQELIRINKIEKFISNIKDKIKEER
jgi:hypothetical protein